MNGTPQEPEVWSPRLFPGSLWFVPGIYVHFCPRIASSDNRTFLLFLRLKLVLPERIELSTSPLPRECSTTELRQRAMSRRIYQGLRFGKAGGCLPRQRAASGLPLDVFVALLLHCKVKNQPDLTPAKRAERAAQEERLAKALRANLRRRKEQRRAREEQKVVQPQVPERGREPQP
jgi:hypothetical protein